MSHQRKKLDNQADAAAVLADLARSGLGLRSFCSRQGFDGRNLRAWSRRLDAPIVAPTAGDTPPLRVVECVLPQTVRDEPAHFRLRLAQLDVDVPPDFDEAALGRLLRVLGIAA
jgi:hypothetical protein